MTLPLASLFGNAQSILCLGAHPDDIEIGCGGTLIQISDLDLDVRWLVLSGSDERRIEAEASAQRYLDDADHLTVHSFRDGFMPYDDPSAVKLAIIEQRERSRPDIVFAPRLEDAHQDHRLIAEFAWQVFRDQIVFEYEIAKYEGDLGSPNTYVVLSEDTVAEKIDRLMTSFTSQRTKPWFDEASFTGLMRLRGIESSAKHGYAEAFTTRKLLVG